MPGLKTGMDFAGQVWKRVWKQTLFGLKQGQDLENWAAYPHQEFPGVLSRALELPFINHSLS